MKDSGRIFRGNWWTENGTSSTGVSDPYLDNTVLLLYFEGTNGQTTTTDSSPSPKTMTIGAARYTSNFTPSEY